MRMRAFVGDAVQDAADEEFERVVHRGLEAVPSQLAPRLNHASK